MLSSKKTCKYQEAFSLLDKNGSGYVTHLELMDLMESFGMQPTENEIIQILNEINDDVTDSECIVQFDKFLATLQNQMKGASDEEMKNLFKLFDKDGDEFISLSDLKIVSAKFDQNLTELQLEEILAEADKNGDGFLCFDEFLELIRNE